MGFLCCVAYMGFLGVVSYPVGRLISWRDPDPDNFWFKQRKWELEGKIYEKLHIKSWQARIPDVSKVLGRWMPQKKLNVGFNAETVRTMIRETCTAEMVHNLLNVAGLRLLSIWDGVGGVVMYLIYFILGNLPFILVQRYNRPRLKNLLNHLELKEAGPDLKQQASSFDH